MAGDGTRSRHGTRRRRGAPRPGSSGAADDASVADLRSELERLKAEVERLSRSESPEPVKRRMSAEQRRTMIIDLALPEFAMHGVNGVTADALATTVGVSQPYLIRLFGSKRELFIAVIHRAFDLLEEEVEQMGETLEGSPADKVTRIAEAHRRLLRSSKVRLAHAQLFASCGDEEIRGVARDRLGKLYGQLQEVTGASDEQMRALMRDVFLSAVLAALEMDAKADEPWAAELLGASLTSARS